MSKQLQTEAASAVWTAADQQLFSIRKRVRLDHRDQKKRARHLLPSKQQTRGATNLVNCDISSTAATSLGFQEHQSRQD